MAATVDQPLEEVWIAVMGITGAGKSTFVKQISKSEVKVSSSLVSCTNKVEAFTFVYKDKLCVHLVDTPGFDDTNKSDADVLKDIASWLTSTFNRDILLGGILLLHRINDIRMSGGSRRNLGMFQKLCGKDCFSSLVVATTHWDGLLGNPIVEEREKELKSTFFQEMLNNGSRYFRHDAGVRSATKIFDHMINNRKRFTTTIQSEMAVQKLDLDQTTAGQQLNADLIQAEQRHRQQMEDAREKYEESRREHDAQMMQETKKTQMEMQEKIDAGVQAQNDLKASMDMIREEKKKERAEFRQKSAAQMRDVAKLQQESKDSREDNLRLQERMKEIQEEVEEARRRDECHRTKDEDGASLDQWFMKGLGIIGKLLTGL